MRAIPPLEFGSTTESVCERVYNVASGTELVADGLSTDLELRLFDNDCNAVSATNSIGKLKGSTCRWAAPTLKSMSESISGESQRHLALY